MDATFKKYFIYSLVSIFPLKEVKENTIFSTLKNERNY